MRSADPPGPWRLLGLALPRWIRETVFEPAYLDLWRAHTQGRPRRSRGQRLVLNLKLFGCFTAAVWYSLPRYVIQHGRFTTLGRAMVAAAAGVTVLMFVTLYPWLSFIATEVAGR